MSYGVVKSMKEGMFYTPNKGTLVDFTTGIEYPFSRPDAESGVVPKSWGVEVNDILSYTIENGEVINPVLYKKHADKIVYYKPS